MVPVKNPDAIFFRYLERPTRGRLAKVVETQYELVWQTAMRVTGNAEDAADVAQDVFLKLLLHPPRPGEVKSARGFLAWEVMGRAANLRRAEERRKAREAAGSLQARENGLGPGEAEEFRAAVRDLEDELRAPVELRYFAGLKNQDIAAALGLSERLLEKRLERAREKLRAKLKHVAPLLFFVDHDKAWSVEPAPASFLEELSRVVMLGEALAFPARLASVGGLLMTKKILLGGAVAALALGSMTLAWRSWKKQADQAGPGGVDVSMSRPGAERSFPGKSDGSPAEDAKNLAEESPEPPRASVHGIVWDDEGHVVAGAKVILSVNLKEEDAADLGQKGYKNITAGIVKAETQSNEDGEYSIAGLLPVKHRFEVEKEGFLACHVEYTLFEAGQDREIVPKLHRHPHRGNERNGIL